MDRLEQQAPIDLQRRLVILRSLSETGTLIAITVPVAMLAAWLVHSLLVQVHLPLVFAMKFNAALGATAVSIAFWLYLRGYPRASIVAASVTMLIGVVTLAEHLFGMASGFGELLIRDWASTAGPDSGRMPIGAALVLVGTSGVVFAFNCVRAAPVRNIAIHIVCLTGIAVGLETIAANVMPPVERIATGFPGVMSVPGALCILALCTAMLAHSLQSEAAMPIRLPLWIPLAACLGIAAVDFVTPLGFSVGIAYIPLVFCALWFERATIVIDFAALSTILIALGVFVSPRGDAELWIAFANRALAIGGVWFNAFLVHAVLVERNRNRRTQLHLSSAQRIAGSGSFEIDFKTMALRGSRAFDAMHGIRDADMHDRIAFMRQAIAPEDRPALSRMIEDARVGIVPAPVDYSFLGVDGVACNAVLHAQLLTGDDGVVIGLIGVVQDVTEMRSAQARHSEIELQLRHAQKLESLGLLAGGISHDLNNTLLPITMIAPMLAKTADAPTRRGLDIVIDAAGRARELVHEILVYSRKDPIAHSPVRIDLLVSEAITILRAGIPANIAIVADVAPVPEITGSKGQLYQTILNLATNAAQAIGSGGGTITIGVGCDDPAIAGDVRLSVTDTGIGMDAETQQRVFEPFFTRRASAEGTGLGLSIVNGIVKAHGGTIAIASAPGHGTRFDLHFPPRTQALAA